MWPLVAWTVGLVALELMTQVLERISVPSIPTERDEEQNELHNEAPTKALAWSFLDDDGFLFAITDR
jgi:hypothetical protein